MMRQRNLDVDVLTAARQRVTNIFANGLPVYLSFSGGKDSLVIAHITASLIQEGKINPRLLRVEFIDEEAIFPCVEQIVMNWRTRLLDLGADQFAWYCLEVRHYSCLNQLENDESFICWDRTKHNVWVRQPPTFAITGHPMLKPRQDTYQEFLAKIRDGVHMTGVRAVESIQRRVFLGKLGGSGLGEKTGAIHPIYDWSDDDVWLYLSQNRVDVPEAYQHLYQIGVHQKNLRISQFFSIDTAHSLARLAEFYPGLMERILLREPTAYIVSLYWDSEMFRRRTRTLRAIDKATADAAQAGTDAPQSQRQRMMDLIAHPPERVLRSPAALQIFARYRNLIMKLGSFMTETHCREVCDALIAGDPKARIVRSLITRIVRDASSHAKSPAAAARGQTGRPAHAGDERADRAPLPAAAE